MAVTEQKEFRGGRIIATLAILGGVARLAMLFASREFLVTYRLPDDALYYFTIAKNFAHGLGLTFDGAHPSSGFHPLWLYLITPFFHLGLDRWACIDAVLLFQSLLDIVVIVLLGILIRDATVHSSPKARLVALIIGLGCYALNPIMIIRGINGLETTVTTVMMLLWLQQYIHIWLEQSTTRGWTKLGTLSALLFLARTDMVILMIPSLVVLVMRKRKSLGMKSALAFIVSGLIISLPWLIWNWTTFGTILQSSAGAVPYFAMKKLDVLYGSMAKYRLLLWETFRNIFKPFVYTCFGLPVLALLYLRKLHHERRFRSKYVIVFTWPLLSAIALLAFHTLFRGFIRDWYVMDLVAFVAVMFAISIAVIIDAAKVNRLVPASYIVTAAGLSMLAIVEFRTPRYSSQQDVVEYGAPFVESLKPDACLASFNSGYYGYFAPEHARIVNLDGVVNAEAIPAIKGGTLRQYMAKGHVDYLLDFRGDIDGFRGLIDHDLTKDYTGPTLLGGHDSTNPLVLFHRMSPIE